MTSHKPKTWKAWGVFDVHGKLMAVRLTKSGAEEAAAWGDYEGMCSIGYGHFTLSKPRRAKK